MKGFMAVFAVALALMLAGCGGGGSKTASTTPTQTPDPGLPVALSAENQGVVRTQLDKLARIPRTMFGSVTQSTNGVTARVTSNSPGQLNVQIGEIQVNNSQAVRRREFFLGQRDPSEVGRRGAGYYTSASGMFELYDENAGWGVMYGAWAQDNPEDFIAGGLWVTRDNAAVFFDGPQFPENTGSIGTATYTGEAVGLYQLNMNQGPIAGALGFRERNTNQIGAWESDVVLVARNGNVSGSIVGLDFYEWATVSPSISRLGSGSRDDRYDVDLIIRLQGQSANGRISDANVSFSYEGIGTFSNVGKWSAQASTDANMIGGTVAGQIKHGRDTLTIGGSFITETAREDYNPPPDLLIAADG